jgi:hypothetical protein
LRRFGGAGGEGLTPRQPAVRHFGRHVDKLS